ncbi:hypothetical protein [Xylanibacter muris]|uniref:Uncharacterized protein n=1 Tax=Xylanibacter muris TaxID=2736290 RepID=A0ABX2AKF8_9BACT|nr:hypothetical protein [Xylanibacter muris]NPD91230.1 hypothetical protein [Xylanibacter muris]
MKGSWISPKVRERHTVCNILLVVFFSPLIILDFFGLIMCSIDCSLYSIIYGLSGILALIGVYGVLLRNKWNGLFLGVLAFFSMCAVIIAAVTYDDRSLHDYIDGISKEQAIGEGLIGSFVITFISTLPILLILLISKNGVSAIKLLEGGGIITKCGIEIIVSILMCCIVIGTLKGAL